MKNYKNFELVIPTEEMLELFNNDCRVLFLTSEDGLDWYKCQSQFSDDTVKIQYDADGFIRSVVDAPVPQRGNIYAVSMLWPVGMYVAEVAVEDYPVGVTLDGTWKFDGTNVYQDEAIVDKKVVAENTAKRDALMAAALLQIGVIQCSIATGSSRNGDSANLLALQQYVVGLMNIDLTVNPATFPEQPASII